MTEAEMMEVLQAIWGNYISAMAVFISVISAYLVIAYMAGKELARSQVILVNILMGVFCAFGIGGMYGFSQTGTEMMQLAFAMSTQRSVHGLTIVPELTIVVFPALALACYKFMWDIRHPDTE